MSEAMQIFEEFNEKAFKDTSDPEVKNLIDSARKNLEGMDEKTKLERILIYMEKIMAKKEFEGDEMSAL